MTEYQELSTRQLLGKAMDVREDAGPLLAEAERRDKATVGEGRERGARTRVATGNKLGIYYAPAHDRPQDWDYIRRLQPAVVRILLHGADAHIVSRVHQTSPQSRISLRWWDIDDGGEGNKRGKLDSPQASGQRDAAEMLRRVEQMEQEARNRGMAFPIREQLIANTLNEPPIWEPGVREQTAAYCRSFLDGLAPHRIPVAVGCINVGHPAEWPPAWDWFQPVIDAMAASPLHLLELHEYWQLAGPGHTWKDEQGNTRRDWGALAGRYEHCPFDAPILIGECGADGRLYEQKAGHTGWQGNLSPDEYAHQLRWYHEKIQQDSRIVAALPFLTDYQNQEWASFDTMPAREEILRVAVPVEAGPITPPPVITPPPPSTGDNFERAIAFVKRWEGGYVNNPNDPGGETNWGISKRSYPDLDIRNLTWEQAKAIYRRDYWQASGANTMPWPLALFHFDAAVNTGVGQASWFLSRSEKRPLHYMIERIEWYTKIRNFEHFGRAWIRRCTDLLREAYEPEDARAPARMADLETAPPDHDMQYNLQAIRALLDDTEQMLLKVRGG